MSMKTCSKCKDTGRIASMVWTGVFMFKPCDCEIAKENERKALEKARKFREELLENLKKVNV